MSKLNILDLRGNHISEIPDWLGELGELVKLDLRWTPVLTKQSNSSLTAIVGPGCRVLL